MLAGELYDALDPELGQARDRARDLCQDLNATREREQELRRAILKQLFAKGGDSVWMQPPFFCDYGSNIYLGERVFFNFNCVILDVCEVTIGDFTLFGPAVQIYTATHPLNHELRRKQEFAKPIAIGSDVWVGGGAIICPGVTIGSKSVIGAGMIPRGEVGLIFAAMGKGVGILDESIFAAMTVVVMVTTFLAPPLLKHLAPPLAGATPDQDHEGIEDLATEG